jgi:hypothetical protein
MKSNCIRIDFLKYLKKSIAEYAQFNKIIREDMIYVFYVLCSVFFSDSSSLQIDDQIKEIEEFSSFLKDYARRKK